MPNEALKWWQRPAAVIATLILFFPLGLFLMWRSRVWSRRTRWIITSCFGVVSLLAALTPTETPSDEVSAAASLAGTAESDPKTSQTPETTQTQTSIAASGTATLSPTSLASPPPTSTATPSIVDATLGPIGTITWQEPIFGVRVHFVAEIVNSGTVPIEVENIRYEMLSPSGAIIERGEVPKSYPRKIAPGANAVIGRTVTADAALSPRDVGSVRIDYDIVEVRAPDNLLGWSNVEARGTDLVGGLIVSGDVGNRSDRTFDDIQIAVVMVDASGAWVGYSTGEIVIGELKPNEVARFNTRPDLPPGLESRVASFIVFAFDE